MLKSLDIDLAGDFLVMAATLMQIKSAMLLPKVAPDDIDDDDLTDPRAELIRQLLEYKKFKDAANLLNAAADHAKSRFNRPSSIIDSLKTDTEPAVDLEQVSVWDLLEAFDSIMTATGKTYDISHITDDTPIDLYQIEILHRLQTEGPMPFDRIFDTAKNRLVMVGLFLALLELIREKLIWVDQPKASKQLHVRSLTDEPAEQAVQKAISTSEAEAETTDTAKKTKTQEKPAIPITEISSPPSPAKAPYLDTPQQPAIPITESPQKSKSKPQEPIIDQ
jgi:segregation and condensation protein A